MVQTVEKWIDDHSTALIAAVQKSVSFRSIDDEKPLEGAPFGKACHDVLLHALSLCDSFGLTTKDLDGYAGYAECGKGEELLGILAHLDVVPEGEGWAHPPYAGEIVDGRIVGRGTLDDKGPAMAAIFALAAVKAAGYDFTRRVRLIFGCDEEKGMRCLAHYTANEEIPTLSFSPDAAYPLVNSEKNIYHGRYEASFPSALTLKSGTVANVVPDKAEAAVPFSKETVEKAAQACMKIPGTAFALAECANGTAITATGKAAHASTPKEGCNALQAMLLLFAALPLTGKDKEAVDCLAAAFGAETNGERVGLKSEDASGDLTLNLGLMDWNADGFALTIDIRAPLSVGREALQAKLSAALPITTCTRYTYSDGYCLPEDAELVQTLLSVYRAHTGSMTGPIHLGGGTYARHLKNAIAFGPEREHEENIIHMPNESIRIDHLIEDAKMYADAIIALAAKPQ